jgi:hypothetical protein
MDTLNLDDTASALVAWHNRHPLARRITAAQVQGVAYLSLPYVQIDVQIDLKIDAPTESGPAPSDSAQGFSQLDDGAGAPPPARARRSRWWRKAAAGTGLLPAFTASSLSEPFFEHRSKAALNTWVQRHGTLEAAKPDGTWQPQVAADASAEDTQRRELERPVRQVQQDPQRFAAAVAAAPQGARCQSVALVLRTAHIDTGTARVAVLLGAAQPGGKRPVVLGKRLWSLPRVGSTAAALLLVAVAGVLGPVLYMPTSAGAVAAGVLPEAHRGKVSTVSTAAAAASAGGVAAPPDASASPKETFLPPAKEVLASPASAPAAEPQWGRVELPSLGPFADSPVMIAARAARQAKRQAQSLNSAASPASASEASANRVLSTEVRTSGQPQVQTGLTLSTRAAATATTTTTTSATATTPTNPGPVYALATRRLRTAAETEQLAAAMRVVVGADASAGGQAIRVEVIADWQNAADSRVVGWPYSSRSSAERAQRQLLARGLKVDVVAF